MAIFILSSLLHMLCAASLGECHARCLRRPFMPSTAIHPGTLITMFSPTIRVSWAQSVGRRAGSGLADILVFVYIHLMRLSSTWNLPLLRRVDRWQGVKVVIVKPGEPTDDVSGKRAHLPSEWRTQITTLLESECVTPVQMKTTTQLAGRTSKGDDVPEQVRLCRTSTKVRKK